jgi:hypothetical protein
MTKKKKLAKKRSPKFEAKVELITRATMLAADIGEPRLACIIMAADQDGHLAMASNIRDAAARRLVIQWLETENERGEMH